MFKKLFNKSKEESTIVSPITGDIVSIEKVPDPVFSQKMMGEGAAIIPTEGKVVAPVNGEIIQVAPTKHAIGLLAEDGSEILIHVGLETVALNGEGFQVHVGVGDKVQVGQALMDFDLAYIQENANDIISPVVITNSSTSNKTYNQTAETNGKAGETVLFHVN
ncbi:PTS sugar transporter subunit IIA [Ornithinibacillus scapharcae]|uniref:PTS sugar transporter subunit IIA n=1 Tax=Ornithinibacillus scapharcae TaxID=1147159 RepID=UPI000225BB70|nr:PTS glucose transporter subunit IIA [Ornithinibacillus scapharcae]